MHKLDLTREEAIELIEEDKRINRMTSLKEVKSDLTPEQQKISKMYCGTGTRQVNKRKTINAYGQKTEVNKKPKENHRLIIEKIISIINEFAECTDLEVINPEREITFKFNGEQKRIILSSVRGKNKKGVD